MRASGNSEPLQCVSNLLRIVRGECVYDRLKGLNPDLIDMNSNRAIPELKEDAVWLIETYEPRVNIEELDIEGMLVSEGGFAINANINTTE